MKITKRSAKKHKFAGKLATMKAGRRCRIAGIPYGSVRTTVWRLRRKYPTRGYRCTLKGGVVWVHRDY